MANKIANIAKNTSFFTFALVLQKVVTFTYFTILARNLVPEDLGQYYFAISFATIFTIIVDLGLNNVLVREVAKKPADSGALLSSVFLIKVPLALLTAGVISLSANLFNYSDLVKDLIYVAAVIVVLDTFSAMFYAFVRGYHSLKAESIGAVVQPLVVLAFGFYAVSQDFGLRYLIGALFLGSLSNFLIAFSLVVFRWRIKINFKPNKALVKQVLAIAIPFAIFGILQKLFGYLDTVLLKGLSNDHQVGLYQIASKTIQAIQFLPMAFVASLYPAFSSYWANNREQLVVTFERSISYLIIIALPISAGIIVLADNIMLLFRPEYAEAVPSLRIMMLSILPIFLIFPVGSLLNACDRQKMNSVFMAIALSISVIMNIILIPRFQISGASFTVLVSNLIMLIIGLSYIPRFIDYSPKKNIVTLIKSLLAVAVMSVFVWYVKDLMNILLVIALSGIIYFSVLYIIGGIKKKDVSSIMFSLKRSN